MILPWVSPKQVRSLTIHTNMDERGFKLGLQRKKRLKESSRLFIQFFDCLANFYEPLGECIGVTLRGFLVLRIQPSMNSVLIEVVTREHTCEVSIQVLGGKCRHNGSRRCPVDAAAARGLYQGLSALPVFSTNLHGPGSLEMKQEQYSLVLNPDPRS